jgi:plastocyanin
LPCGYAETTVRAHINVAYAKGAKQHAPTVAPNAVIWLTAVPLASGHLPHLVHPDTFRLEQKNKEFTPHLLVVPSGSTIMFPNLDPFFHNVFSLFNGKRFDLGLYETGQSRAVRFDRPGVSYIFCNIHPEMSAVVITLDTPYYAVASSSGNAVIAGVPPGEYDLKVWVESASEAQLSTLTRRVKVSSQEVDLGDISAVENPVTTHKNKFGEDYLKQAAPPY